MSIHQVEEIQIAKLACSQVAHQGELIKALCLNPNCKESSALCSKCLFETHINCANYIETTEVLPKQLLELQKLQIDIMALSENINQQFKELLSQIELIMMPIHQYQIYQNFGNLVGIGFLLKKLPKQNILHSFDLLKIEIKILIDNSDCIQTQFPKIRIKLENSNQNQIKKILDDNDDKQEKELEVPNYDTWFWYGKGKKLFENFKYDEAIDCFDMAIQIDSKNQSSWHSKGEALSKIEKLQESINCFEEALKLDPNWQCAKDSLVEVKLKIFYQN